MIKQLKQLLSLGSDDIAMQVRPPPVLTGGVKGTVVLPEKPYDWKDPVAAQKRWSTTDLTTTFKKARGNMSNKVVTAYENPTKSKEIG